MAGLQITTAPTTEPVTLQEAKEYLRIGDSTDERVLQNFIETARMAAEDHMGRAIMPQTLSYFTDAYDELADPLFEGFRTGPYLNYYKNYIESKKAGVNFIAYRCYLSSKEIKI